MVEKMIEEEYQNKYMQFLNKKLFIQKSELYRYISDNFLLNDESITKDVAKYLFSQEWYEMKEIMIIKGFKYPMEFYRYLKHPECGYMKIKEIGGEKKMARYIRL